MPSESASENDSKKSDNPLRITITERRKPQRRQPWDRVIAWRDFASAVICRKRNPFKRRKK